MEKGYKRPPRNKEWCDKLSASHKGQIPWNKGKKMSKEYREKCRQGILKRYKRGEEIGFQKGHTDFVPLFSRKIAAIKISESLRGKYTGEKSTAWRGGMSSPKNKRKRQNLWHNKEYKQNNMFRLNRCIRSRVYDSLSRKIGKKGGLSWEKLVGYTIKELRCHLEKQFTLEMTWDNYGSYWHIDHIKPISLFKYTTPEDPEFKKCWALENLQPLEASENRRKNNSYKEKPGLTPGTNIRYHLFSFIGEIPLINKTNITRIYYTNVKETGLTGGQKYAKI